MTKNIRIDIHTDVRHNANVVSLSNFLPSQFINIPSNFIIII